MTFKQFAVDPRLGVEPLGKTLRYHQNQVFIPDLVFNEQDQMIPRRIGFAFLAEPAFLRDVDLAADDRFDPGVLAGTVERNGAVKDPVVGDGNG